MHTPSLLKPYSYLTPYSTHRVQRVLYTLLFVEDPPISKNSFDPSMIARFRANTGLRKT